METNMNQHEFQEKNIDPKNFEEDDKENFDMES